MSCYMLAAAMCDLKVASNGPIKLDERSIVAPMLARCPDPKRATAAQPDLQPQAAVAPEAGEGKAARAAKPVEPSPEDRVRELKEAGYTGVERYSTIGGSQVREKALKLGEGRHALRSAHTEEAMNLLRQQEEEEAEIEREALRKAEARQKELEAFLAAKKAEKEAAQRAAEEERQGELRKTRVHPIDILQGQIAANLAAEREAELEELENNTPSWIERLDTYMDIEKGAWREHSALSRAPALPGDEHKAAVEELRKSLACEGSASQGSKGCRSDQSQVDAVAQAAAQVLEEIEEDVPREAAAPDVEGADANGAEIPEEASARQ